MIPVSICLSASIWNLKENMGDYFKQNSFRHILYLIYVKLLSKIYAENFDEYHFPVEREFDTYRK